MPDKKGILTFFVINILTNTQQKGNEERSGRGIDREMRRNKLTM